MHNTQQSRKHSIYSSCIISKPSQGRQEGSVSTASIAWVVVSLLILSQPGTSVCALTQSQKTPTTVPCPQTNYFKPNHQPPRPTSGLMAAKDSILAQELDSEKFKATMMSRMTKEVDVNKVPSPSKVSTTTKKPQLTPVQQTSLVTAFWRNCEQQRTDKEPLCVDPQAPILLEKLLERDSMESLLASPFFTGGVNLLAVRTRFIDDFILDSALSVSGRQVGQPQPQQLVLLGSGMDTRAYRLNLHKDSVVIEVDSDMDVLRGKHDVLAMASHKATCRVATVAVDISESEKVVSKVVTAGLKSTMPTVWVLEGLLEYLKPSVHPLLLSALRRKSFPGTRIVLQCLEPSFGEYSAKLGLALPYQQLVTVEQMKRSLLEAGFCGVRVHNQDELQHRFRRILPPGFVLMEAHVKDEETTTD